MRFEELIKNLEKVEPITFIAIGKNLGFYFNHKIYHEEETGKLLGINYECKNYKKVAFPKFEEEYFTFKQPVYKNHFGLSFLNMERSMSSKGSSTEMSTLVLEENLDLPFSINYKEICSQLKRKGFDVRDFVKKIKEEIEPSLREQYNLNHKIESVVPI